MDSLRPYQKIKEPPTSRPFPIDMSEQLAHQFMNGAVSFEYIKDFITKEKLNFWHLFDLHEALNDTCTNEKSWLKEALLPLATSSVEIEYLLSSLDYPTEIQNTLHDLARKNAETYEDFDSLIHMDLFYPEDVPHMLTKITHSEDLVHMDNFASQQYTNSTQEKLVRIALQNSMKTLEDFMQVYIYTDDLELRDRVKKAIELLHGKELSQGFGA